MRTRDRKTAEQFGFLARALAFESSLLEIEGIVPEKLGEGIDFDLNGWLSGIRYVIIVPKYHIPVEHENYFSERSQLIQNVLDVASKFGLCRTEDRIEDYGAHFYIVFRCDASWPQLPSE